MNVVSFWKAGAPFRAPAPRKLRAMIEAAAKLAGLSDDDCPCVCVSFLSPAGIERINREYLGHHGSTDVISFDYRAHDGTDCFDEDDPAVELFVCPAVALREARKRNLPFEREVTLYVAHGLLHAAGFDDLNPKAKRVMRRNERRVMKGLDERSLVPSIFEPEGEVKSTI